MSSRNKHFDAFFCIYCQFLGIYVHLLHITNSTEMFSVLCYLNADMNSEILLQTTALFFSVEALSKQGIG